MLAAEAGLQRGTPVSLPLLVAVATVAAVFKSVQNRQSQIRRMLFKSKDDQFRTGAVDRPPGRMNWSERRILSDGLDAIRDSRIASQRNNLSQSEAALKLQISKRTLQEWEQGRAAPRGFARTAIEKAIRV